MAILPVLHYRHHSNPHTLTVDFMRLSLFITMLFVSNIGFGQSPYDAVKGELRNLFDAIPIDKGQEVAFFKYATTLCQQDSLKRAGQIFDRLYWLDTTSIIGKQSFQFRKQIEAKVTKQTQDKLKSVWIWTWSGTNWGPSDLLTKNGKTKRIELNGSVIRFYRNDTLIRQTKYTLRQNFDWVGGFLTNHLQYLDSNEEWYFNFASINNFTSERLWIEQKSNILCGNYGECYLRDPERKPIADINVVVSNPKR